MSKPTDLRDALRVKPGSQVRLVKRDPAATFGHDKTSAVAATEAQMVRLRNLQDRLWAESKHSVLVVLQGIDASGKDGTIAKVMEAFNPQGCPVTSFKVPSAEELAHDFLWRVHNLVPRRVWSKRYDQINAFEETLAASGTTIVKFFLTIDRDEQRQRLQDRYDDPKKRWKFKLSDLDERKLWDDYKLAFDDALSKTSTPWAPWYVIPANRNWFRNLAVSTILADSISALKPAYPPEPDLPKDLVIE
jgi:polyphosphate kinase 2 (PPK2 family)